MLLKLTLELFLNKAEERLTELLLNLSTQRIKNDYLAFDYILLVFIHN
jgi:hypothetical protein